MFCITQVKEDKVLITHWLNSQFAGIAKPQFCR